MRVPARGSQSLTGPGAMLGDVDDHAAADYSALRPIVDAEFGVVLGTYSVVEPELTGADVAQGIPLR